MNVLQQIKVHFSPGIISKIGTGQTRGWADALRDWHHNNDPDRNFGRNVANSRCAEHTWAWHLHMSPKSEADLWKWDIANSAYNRTSDRLLVYSMDKEKPMRFGLLLLAFLAPDGHYRLINGPSAAQRREDWENIAYTHQMSGNMPDGTITET